MLLSVLLFFTSCQKKQAHSHPKYLDGGSYACEEYDTQRINEIKELFPEGYISGYSQEELDEYVYPRLAGIPNVYHNYLIDFYREGRLKGIVGKGFTGPSGGVMGVTSFVSEPRSSGSSGRGGMCWFGICMGGGGGSSGGSGPAYMLATEVSTKKYNGRGTNPINFALQHEIGHAVMRKVRLDAEAAGVDYENGIRALYADVRQIPNVRSYAKSQEAEAFAESFANYYCSPESKEFIDRYLRKTSRDFLAAVFAEPVYSRGTGDTTPVPSNGDIAEREPVSDEREPEPAFREKRLALLPKLDNSIKIMLKENNSTYNLYVSTKNTTTKLELCENTDWEICVEDEQRLNNKLTTVFTSKNSKRVFKINISSKSELLKKKTLLTYDNSNNLTSIRVVSIENGGLGND